MHIFAMELAAISVHSLNRFSLHVHQNGYRGSCKLLLCCDIIIMQRLYIIIDLTCGGACTSFGRF